MDALIDILRIYPSLKYGLAILGYMALVRSMRYRRINALLAKYPDPTLPLRNLDIARECCSNINDLEFPFLNVTSLEFALFKTFAIPSISKVLVATKELSHHCLKRTDDTVFILLEMTELHSRIALRTINEGKFDPEAAENDHKRFQTSLERLNFIHGHYKIDQEEYLYTLALFILEPPSFIGRFEWRPLTLLERNALLAHWTYIGKGMGIKNIPDNLDDLMSWSEEYESQHAVFDKNNIKIAEATVSLLLSMTPKFTHGVLQWGVSALLTNRLRVAFGFAPPPKGVTTFVYSLLWLRGRFIQYFMLPRRKPMPRTGLRANHENKYVPAFHKYTPVYPDGYRIEELGPNKFLGKCPASSISAMASPSSAFHNATMAQ
ncbi:hypothetical protein BGZ93_000087 [Podila epicladia]|nr:hypothetical protein BGZ93_000087 [Podila epicladia]